MRTIVMVTILSIGINLGIHYYFLNRDFALRNFSRQQITEEKVPAKSTASSHDIVKKSGGSSQISIFNEKSGLKDGAVMNQNAKNFQSENSDDVTVALKQSQWVWEPVKAGIPQEKILGIKSSFGSDDLFVRASNTLYQFTHENKAEVILDLTCKDCTLNSIYVSRKRPLILFAATSQGLYIREGKAGKWRLAFTHSLFNTRNCLSVLATNEQIYLGTANGLFLKEKDSTVWRKIEGEFKEKLIGQILEDKECVYFHTKNAVFRINKNTKQIKKVFLLNEKMFGDPEEPPEEEEVCQAICKINILENQNLLIVTSKGFFLSSDQGQTFHNTLINRNLYNEVTGIIDFSTSHGGETIRRAKGSSKRENPESVQDLIVGTKRGAFFLAGDKWTSLYKGLTTNVINDLARDEKGNVYAATDRGLFYLSAEKTLPVLGCKDFDEACFPKTQETAESLQKETKTNKDKIRSLFKDEPTIEQIHQWAIAYAEVSNHKIQAWRKQAKKRAWFPKFSMGLDGGKSKTISDSIYGSYSSGGQSFIGPDDKTFHDDFGWDVDLTWDLADLIYTSEQTSIDSRAKLMVELRDDILDQITRLFFERKRLIFESMNHQQEEGFDAIDYALRIEELTALIDGMTGGEFLKDQKARMTDKKESE